MTEITDKGKTQILTYNFYTKNVKRIVYAAPGIVCECGHIFFNADCFCAKCGRFNRNIKHDKA